mmetsp:Transcript_5762/g.7077  ORF Transcript_5762/g.7077 Transcript_5762/m.7077 type:complete len:498 (+) Transcript_5762:329-1822(+)
MNDRCFISKSVVKRKDMWRDTLHYWSGTLKLVEETVRDSSHFELPLNQMNYTVTWIGKIVTLPHCPDARNGPTPNEKGYTLSPLKFSVSGRVGCEHNRRYRAEGNISGHETNLKILKIKGEVIRLKYNRHTRDLVLSMNGGSGFDYSGEEGNTLLHSDEKSIGTHKLTIRKHRDTERTILFSEESQSSTGGLVIGKGRNQFGHFMEIGRTPQNTRLSNTGFPKELQLTRRYLEENDDRVNWSIYILKSQILGILPLLDNDEAWNHVLGYVGYSNHTLAFHKSLDYPWRSLVLHATKWRQKSLCNSQGILLKCSLTGILPEGSKTPIGKLMMPIEGDSFRLQLSDDFDANTTWEGQCYGCGGPGATRDLTFTARVWTHEEPYDTFILGAFCSSECIGRSYISELSRCSFAWKKSSCNSNLFLGNSDTLFWNSLSEEQRRSIMSAGWSFKGWGSDNWVLLPDCESDQDDHAGSNYDLDQDGTDNDYESDHHDYDGIDWY